METVFDGWAKEKIGRRRARDRDREREREREAAQFMPLSPRSEDSSLGGGLRL